MKTETVLYAVKKGAPDWQEEIITTKRERIPEAKKWASENGFDRFRVAEFGNEKPDFIGTLHTREV